MATENDLEVVKADPIDKDLSLSIEAIIIIVVCLYVILVLAFLVIRKIATSKGMCQNMQLCGSASGDAGFCECFMPCVEALNCRAPSLKRSLDVCCRQRQFDVAGCMQSNGTICCNFSGFDCVPGYTGEDADAINCICFELRPSGQADSTMSR